MNGKFLPDDIVEADLYNLSSFNNASVLQFYHRITAYILLFFVIILNFFFIKKKIKLNSIFLFDLAILFQIFIGILTLITGVKIYYASLHQLGSVLVLICFLTIYYKNTS